MQKTKKVRITNKDTGEVSVYNSPLEAAKALDYQYITIIGWISGRIENKKYKAEYVENEI